ncbi:CapA family protein [Pseudochryseolinea flava]|uniref:CapA family protein n=1 Tax=Pseudochryseolinea flava TaxID=2059302 RepID=A0A364XW36_9BACT|nr:CapA family protein [Pseudochryseolinea flava]RAV97940.1 CapA family protein [Pseudochryseolinea flava]
MNIFKYAAFVTTFLLAFNATAQVDSTKRAPDTLSIIGVGDIMMGTSYPEDKLPGDDGAFLMKDVESVLRDADVTFGNLEGTLLDVGGTPKSCKDPKVCYVFRTPTRYVRNLISAGFDMMSLANNHAGDFGEAGRKSSMKTLEVAGILHAGQINQPYVTFTKDSITYGLAAFAPNSNCVPLNDLEGAKRIVAHLDSICDIVIVSYHGGAEGAQFQNVPRTTELYHGENRGDVYKFSRTLIDVGADVVFGHGPHVTRAIDVYKGRFIAYSLGNFCTYRGISVSGVNGLAPIIKVYTDHDGKLFNAQIIPTYQTYGTGVRVDAQKQVIKKIQELTKKDFPESKVQIDDNGLITYLSN